ALWLLVIEQPCPRCYCYCCCSLILLGAMTGWLRRMLLRQPMLLTLVFQMTWQKDIQIIPILKNLRGFWSSLVILATMTWALVRRMIYISLFFCLDLLRRSRTWLAVVLNTGLERAICQWSDPSATSECGPSL